MGLQILRALRGWHHDIYIPNISTEDEQDEDKAVTHSRTNARAPCKLISGFIIALLTISHVAKIPSLERRE